MNLNKAFIIGNLTRDPELKTLPSGTAVVTFAVATNRNWKNQQGQKQQDTQFHNIVAFGKQAEIVNQYLKKGSMIMIEGRIQNRSWDAQDGTKKYRSEIVMENMQMGPRKFTNDFTGTPSNVNQKQTQTKTINKQEESLDTIEYPEEESDPNAMPF